MQTYTGIHNRSPVYTPKPMGGAAPYGSGATRQHFDDVYRQQAQRSRVDLDRKNTEQAAGYYANARQAQDQSVLSGLGLLNTQQQNAWQRQNARSQMAYDWLNDVTGGMTGMLRGLL